MIYKGTESNTRPPRVLIENLPGGIKHVRLADNIEELTSEEGATFYRYDESVFTTKDVVTAEEIEANFAEYWEKGKDAKQDDDPDPVTPMTRKELTEKVQELGSHLDMIDECLLEMSEKVYE